MFNPAGYNNHIHTSATRGSTFQKGGTSLLDKPQKVTLMKKLFILLLVLTTLLIACGPSDNNNPAAVSDNTTAEKPAENGVDPAPPAAPTEELQFAGDTPAPEFPVGLDWLNSDPLALADLRGKVVLLDFWTYGCINCVHVIPDLKALEEKYADELVVIGVHSAKFTHEGETENIRRIILRYELEHPVINDNNFQVWNMYGARAWPTFVLIDPAGNVLGYHSGEGIYDLFDFVIDGMINEFADVIDRTPLDLVLERESLVDSPLLFPGKVLADEANNRLFIADSNHNRIVITDLDGVVLEVIGDGRIGLQDGNYETAQFFRPQGLTLADPDTLYVADTVNHVIRRIDLNAKLVETVAGVGRQVYQTQTIGPALTMGLNSPWDVLYHDDIVYIAMAGQHQLWAYDVTAQEVFLFAGSGREELRDGPLHVGGLNQPSGLATDGEVVYFADSEASAIRSAGIGSDGQLRTIVGTGLFDFGDLDGVGDDVLLQHPLGVVYQDGLLFIADTYNSKIKRIDPESRETTTILGGDESGWQDGVDPLFDEPGGLSISGDRIYIADTNNHVIRVANLETSEVETLVLIDSAGLLTRQPAGEAFTGQTIALEPQTVPAGTGTIQLAVEIPIGYKVNDLAPFSMVWNSDNEAVAIGEIDATASIVNPTFPLEIPVTFSEGETTLTADLVIYYCEAEAESLCLIEQVRIIVPVMVTSESGSAELIVPHIIPLPPDV